MHPDLAITEYDTNHLAISITGVKNCVLLAVDWNRLTRRSLQSGIRGWKGNILGAAKPNSSHLALFGLFCGFHLLL